MGKNTIQEATQNQEENVDQDIQIKSQDSESQENVDNHQTADNQTDYDAEIRKNNPLYPVAKATGEAYLDLLHGHSDPATDAIGFLIIGGLLVLGDEIKKACENSAEQRRIEEAKRLEEAKHRVSPFSFMVSMFKQLNDTIRAEMQVIREKLASTFVGKFSIYSKPTTDTTTTNDSDLNETYRTGQSL